MSVAIASAGGATVASRSMAAGIGLAGRDIGVRSTLGGDTLMDIADL